MDPDQIEAFTPVEGGLASLNPQPLPPGPPDDARRLALSAGVEDIVDAQPLPGFGDQTLVVARTRDGSGVIVAPGGPRPRIAGRFEGPLVAMQYAGSFAIAASGGEIHLFAVHGPVEMAFNR
ncbi:MAG: hypothetical protein WDO12_01680 [Pseudomonadota bacterium]